MLRPTVQMQKLDLDNGLYALNDEERKKKSSFVYSLKEENDEKIYLNNNKNFSGKMKSRNNSGQYSNSGFFNNSSIGAIIFGNERKNSLNEKEMKISNGKFENFQNLQFMEEFYNKSQNISQESEIRNLKANEKNLEDSFSSFQEQFKNINLNSGKYFFN